MALSPVRRVLFRCDASSEIGLGHVVRCHALADELSRRGMEPWFAARSNSAGAFEFLEGHGHPIIPMSGALADEGDAIRAAVAPASVRGRRPFATVVLDHYEFGADWLRAARRLASQLIVIDDLANRALPCDVLVNGNLGAQPDWYAGLSSQGTRLLLGSRYCLLRAGIAAAHEAAARRSYSTIRSVLVTLGGTDHAIATRLVVEAVRKALPEAAIDLVLGQVAGELGSIESSVLRVHRGVDDAEMARLMAAADLAVGAGGMTSWERCALALPSIAIRLAPNQDVVVDALSATGAAVDGGPVQELTMGGLVELILILANGPGVRSMMGRRAWDLIDGRGTVRVAHQIEGVRVREANLRDSRLLWTWTNDPVTRAASVNPSPIPYEDHVRWLRATLEDPSRLLLVGWNGAGQLGQVRFDRRGEEAEVSISVAPEHRTTVGGLLLRAGIQHFRRKWPRLAILAQVKEENLASRRLFERAEFDLAGRVYGLLQYRLSGDGANPRSERRLYA